MIRYLLPIVFFVAGCYGKREHPPPVGHPVHEALIQFGNGALLLTQFSSYEEFKSIVNVEFMKRKRGGVILTHASSHGAVTSILNPGVSELDFLNAYDHGMWKKILLVFKSPYGVINIQDLRRIYAMARRRGEVFDEGDIAFYDLAENMMHNIRAEDQKKIAKKHISEKGYLNTFNHIVAQAFMTSIFSERLADFVADIHERRNMPELVTGAFSEEQIKDIENGVIDNYVDIVNNEWGQELGKILKNKYSIDKKMTWTPELLRDYLNDIQLYCTWSLKIGFKPFQSSDDFIIKFSRKINTILHKPPSIR